MRADADVHTLLPPHHEQQLQSTFPHKSQGGAGAATGVQQCRPLAADMSRVERPFPDMDEMVELLRLLRLATGKPTAVFNTPHQVACCYQAVAGSHEVTIVLPTGACTYCVINGWWWMECSSAHHSIL